MFEALENRTMLSVSVSGGVLTVDGSDNAYYPDFISVTENVQRQKYVVTEAVGTRIKVRLVNQALVNKIVVNGGAGDDIIKVVSSHFQDQVVIHGDDGNDFMTGGLEKTTFDGGEGEDVANYGDGILNLILPPLPSGLLFRNFDLQAIAFDEDHNRIFTDPVAGQDDLINCFGQGVVVTINDVADDGVQTAAFYNQERDDVMSTTEDVVGTIYDDLIVGNDCDNALYGGPGADTIYGGYGDDYINGGSDSLVAKDEADELYGEEGDDSFWSQEDLLSKSAHDNVADLVYGGDGWDSDIADYADRFFGTLDSIEELDIA